MLLLLQQLPQGLRLRLHASDLPPQLRLPT